jgi:hypothetical protein
VKLRFICELRESMSGEDREGIVGSAYSSDKSAIFSL